MSNKSSSGARLDPYLKAIKPSPFWRRKKEQNPGHKDFRAASEDLPISDLQWTYKIEMYEQH